MSRRKLKTFGGFTWRVSPEEYDWKRQFLSVLSDAHVSGQLFVTVDAGKLAGVCESLEEFEEKAVKEEKSKSQEK